MTQPASLEDRFYPITTSLSSCIQLPETKSKSFKIKPQFINTLPNYYGLESENAYFFIRKFEEVSLIMRIPQLGDDAVRLRFVPFTLKHLAKKWLYSLAEKSITSWHNFFKAFLKKFYPIHKTALMRRNIMQCKQEPNEPC